MKGTAEEINAREPLIVEKEKAMIPVVVVVVVVKGLKRGVEKDVNLVEKDVNLVEKGDNQYIFSYCNIYGFHF